MSVQHFKVIGLVVVLLGLIGGLMFGVHVKAEPLVIGVFGTAIGAGTTVAFRWFTNSGGDDKSGPAAVLLVAGTILAAGDGCASPAARAVEAEAAYANEQARCLDDAPAIASEDVPIEVRRSAWGRYDACLAAVRARWGITEAVAQDGGR